MPPCPDIQLLKFWIKFGLVTSTLKHVHILESQTIKVYLQESSYNYINILFSIRFQLFFMYINIGNIQNHDRYKRKSASPAGSFKRNPLAKNK